MDLWLLKTGTVMSKEEVLGGSFHRFLFGLYQHSNPTFLQNQSRHTKRQAPTFNYTS